MSTSVPVPYSFSFFQVSLDADDRLAGADNRLTVVEGRVDVVRQDFVRSEQRLDVVVARAAEDSDAHMNEL